MTVHLTKHIGHVSKCPKCSHIGQSCLFALFQKSKPNSTIWTGPYFMIVHYKDEYSTSKYMKKRLRGHSSLKARSSAHKTRYVGYCYFSKSPPTTYKTLVEQKIKNFNPEEEWLARIQKRSGAREHGE